MNAHYIQQGNWKNVPYNLTRIFVVLGRHIEKEALVRSYLAGKLSILYPNTPFIFTGYNGEAEKMYAQAIDFGMDPNHPVILETEAKNMRENFELTYSILDQLKIQPHSIQLKIISCVFCSLRAWMTFRAKFPKVSILTRWAYEEFDLENELDKFTHSEALILEKYNEQFFNPTPPKEKDYPTLEDLIFSPSNLFSWFLDDIEHIQRECFKFPFDKNFISETNDNKIIQYMIPKSIYTPE